MGDTMNLRQEAVSQIVSSLTETGVIPDRDYCVHILDALLDWLDTNAEHIADEAYGLVSLNQMVRRFTAALRKDTDD